MHEAQMHETNSFITLTYDDAYLPPDGALRVRDWQLFAKRVRKNLGPFRFFHCGEYGPRTNRPHYHAAIFGQDFTPWHHIRDKQYFSESLARLWGLGNISTGTLNYEAAAYVARYIMKKQTGDNAIAEYGDAKPPYVTMSRRPGLGIRWWQKFKDDVLPNDEVVHNGRKHRVPAYYDQQLSEEALREVKERRLTRLSKCKEDLTPNRLRAREKAIKHDLQRTQRDKN